MPVNRKKLAALLVGLLANGRRGGHSCRVAQGHAGGDEHQIMIGGTFPYTGPASLYKTIPSAEQAYYA